MAHKDFKELKLSYGDYLEPCPVCGAGAELWQQSEAIDSPTRKVVKCTTYDGFGPQDREVYEGCLLSLPPHEFYKATIHEAVAYWNAYAQALVTLRQENNSKRAQVPRAL